MLATFKTCTARALFIPSLLCLFLAHSPRLPPPAVVLTFRDSDHQIVCRNILHVNSCLGRTSNFVKYLFFPFFFFLQKFLFLIFLDSEAKREDSRFLRFQVLSSPINLGGMLSGVSISSDSIVHWTARFNGVSNTTFA